MDIISVLKKLTQDLGISGFEDPFAQSVCEMLKEYCPDAKVNKTGSVIGTLNGSSANKKTILLEAHLDRIGLVVSEILEDGFVKFKALGGVDERTLPASEVYILGKSNVYGVIGALPPHLKKGTESVSELKISDMLIDTGLSGDKARESFGVGDPILLKSDFTELAGGIVSSAALDNRAGMAAVLECLDCIKDKELPCNVKVAFTTGEELGLHGARTLLYDDTPDLAVVIDVTHGRTPDALDFDTFPLGCGAIICRGPNLHYEATLKTISTAKEKGIPYDIEVAAGNTGTNAWILQISGKGVPCVLVSIPLRYMHTVVETVDTADIKSAGTLLAEMILGGDIVA
ncbi:MAG: M20/M25/M40 family metallo-hydrolase [Clostridia bacterium]|nr:M20/M25/M40 family metallo-hydrolase [Clostridia bacterium]